MQGPITCGAAAAMPEVSKRLVTIAAEARTGQTRCGTHTHARARRKPTCGAAAAMPEVSKRLLSPAQRGDKNTQRGRKWGTCHWAVNQELTLR